MFRRQFRLRQSHFIIEIYGTQFLPLKWEHDNFSSQFINNVFMQNKTMFGSREIYRCEMGFSDLQKQQ